MTNGIHLGLREKGHNLEVLEVMLIVEDNGGVVSDLCV